MQAMLGNFRSAAGGGTLLYNLDASALGALLGSSITTSASFNGTTKYLSSTSGLFTYTGDFTVEGWYYPTTSVQQTLFCLGTEDTNQYRFYLYGSSINSILYGSSALTYTSTVNINTWTHIAVVRSGSTVSLYINGIASPTTDTQAGTLGNGLLNIGVRVFYDASFFTGNISNFRIVNSAVYTGNFTPPTTTLRAVPGTVLLLPLTSAPFMDLSSNLLTVTNSGGTATSVQAPSLTTGTTDVTGTYTISYNLPVATFTGSISGTTLTVSGVTGTITSGMTVTGSSVPSGTCIVSGSGSTWTVNASVVVSSTSMEASIINWFGTQGGVFSSLNTSVLSNAYITGGPNILANTSYTVMMAYRLTNGSAGSTGRLLNSYGQSGDPNGWVMGGNNGRYAVWYSDGYGNIYGSGTDTVWHIDFVTFDKTSQNGNIFSSTSSQPTATPTQSFSPFSNQGVYFGLRLFSRPSPSGGEPSSGDIGMVKVWNGVLTTTQMQTEYNAYKARFGY
jgi:hypothetical protein